VRDLPFKPFKGAAPLPKRLFAYWRKDYGGPSHKLNVQLEPDHLREPDEMVIVGEYELRRPIAVSNMTLVNAHIKADGRKRRQILTKLEPKIRALQAKAQRRAA